MGSPSGVRNCNQLYAHLYFGPRLTEPVVNCPASDKTALRVHVRSTSKDTRPVNLDLGTIQLPVTAYASITHRVTGVLMFFASFLLLWALDRSLASEESFNALSAMLGSALAKGVIWAVATDG